MNEFQIYSPEEQLHDPLFAEKGIRVFLKRDDMIHPFISGNKWRKLKLNIRDAKANNRDHLVTFGGVWSNHLLATACAAAKYGLKSTAFVRGEDVNSDVIVLCRVFGMQLIFTDRSAYRDKKGLYEKKFSHDPSTVFIDEGGAGHLAMQGCAEIILELGQYYDHLFCAAGTGTTFAGLVKGVTDANLSTTCHCIPALKGADFLKEDINAYFDVPPSYSFHDAYSFGGYAKTTPELLRFIRDFTSTTGILLDPVYTGKMMFALYALIREDHFPKDSTILAIHTGGLFGLLGMKEQIVTALNQN
ncbi:1-aminocyclopropane-1-carboxylate deaminase/D-cysteine desulfhydrase [Arcticibacter sp.]|uniref:1-aminocyclopropane-1-carboxylate deaminase/D-cysteine desulfhydrase n=1 Tax=Arcticibacter sp. TaxID=1872630 RepID=UPI00388E2FF0